MDDIKKELVASALSFDQEQMLRSKEFEAAYQQFLAGNRKPRTPITRKQLDRHQEQYFYGCVLPGRIMPGLYFGDGWADHAGYVPIDRRFVLTSTAFGEIFTAGDKTPRRKMVQVQ
jgi:hypothetical protein